jgi:hypothetical protein
MKTIPRLLGIAALSLLAACGNSSVESPHDDHEHETITTVELKFVNRALASDSFTLRYVDLDGPGGAAPILPSAGRIQTGALYDASVRFLDQSNPADVHDLSEEIGGSASDEHRVFWTTGPRMNAATVDFDTKGLVLGLKAIVTPLSVGLDTLRINLRHLPGTKSDTTKITDGATDADVAFPFQIVAP